MLQQIPDFSGIVAGFFFSRFSLKVIDFPYANDWLHGVHIRIMEIWKIIFLSRWVICRFHVNLPGCSILG